ncbi:GNAT family N-acetyltransferase [candidate division CSSED10-310 bacterium]|uniref:GNAT family N-acetyltransferase n=1 Tax=candidate division CSSED10-310 bacterium TaxID=2855610 RepID=A0ABV6Z053_UNCC1
MNFFEIYAPRPRGEGRPSPPDSLTINLAEPADVEAIASLSSERSGLQFDAQLQLIQNEISGREDTTQLFVAQHDHKVVGFARNKFFTLPADIPANCAPPGWYLQGIIVDPAYRRLGIASELTQRRLHWLAGRASEAYYFCNAQNQVSIDLHQHFGFKEMTRNFTFPGVTFQGGIGILYRINLTAFSCVRYHFGVSP